MIHLLFHRDADAVRASAMRIAAEEKTWTFGQFVATEVPGVSRAELEVRDATLEWTLSEFRNLARRLLSD